MALCPGCRTVIPCHCHATPPVELAPGIYLDTSRTDHPKENPMTTSTDDSQLCGITRDYRGTEHPPCTRTASHIEAYCRGKDGTLFLAHPDEPARTAATEPLTTQQHDWPTAAARRALDSLTDLIRDSSDPGTEALAARHELEQALLTGQRPPADAPEAVPALLADNQRLRQQLAELQPAALHARSALAALCYDLDDPGSNALGALYLLQQATSAVDAPRDDAAQALAKHDADVMRRCATFVRDTYDGDWADDAAATLERDADITERGCPGFEKAQLLATCKHCGRTYNAHAAAASAAARPAATEEAAR